MTEQIWLIGAGRMARAYADVLKALDVVPLVVCRSAVSAERFSEETGLRTVSGGVAAALASHPAPDRAVIAIDVAELATCAASLLEAGCRHVLIEKPAGLNHGEVSRLSDIAQSRGAHVHVAYNRRFYGSVLQARQGLDEDGGAVSMTFDFTEASDAIVTIGHRPEVLDEWLLANSTHVIDTAFFLAGEPDQWTGAVDGSLQWHPRAARFAGHGRTHDGALFSYLADWDAPGRWAIEISSRFRRFILKPMEQLQIQHRGSFKVEVSAPTDDLDERFKPGIFRQVRAFLGGEGSDLLPTIAEHRDRIATIYAPMLTNRSGAV
ncbi:MAG: Gfo/Idh/MocA family protein [Brevundimonas sp.]